MKLSSSLFMVVKVIAIAIIVAYGIGLFKTYGLLQASAMFAIAIFMGVDLVFMAKQATGKN